MKRWTFWYTFDKWIIEDNHRKVQWTRDAAIWSKVDVDTFVRHLNHINYGW